MERTREVLTSVICGVVCLGTILVLAWGAACLAHGEEVSTTAHIVMGVVTFLTVAGFVLASIQMFRREAAKR